MSDESGGLTVAQRLSNLLSRGLLSVGGPAEAAERLIERLERPARIGLLGLPGAGKSAVLNLLAGQVVVPEMLRLPTVIVQYGAEARMLCTLTDGRVETVAGSDLSQIMAMSPAMVTLQMNLAALKVISLLEVSAGPMEADQRRAANWASKRADIVIWCTTSYLPKEQIVWESMPDTVKDNGFLFLTKVDLLGSREAAAGVLERVEQRAGDEFRQVLSLSAKQARTALLSGTIDRELFRDSGAAAVITTIKNRVQMARQADTDMAELLLARHVEAEQVVAQRFAGSTPEENPSVPSWTPPPEEVAPVKTARPVTENRVAQIPRTTQTEHQPIVEPGPPETKPASVSLPESKRFSELLKQSPLPDAEVPSVAKTPPRATWKSRAETAAPRRRRDPVPDVTPADMADSGGTEDNSADDAVIAAMLAAAAAPAREVTVDRPSYDAGVARGAEPLSAQEPRRADQQLLGGRAPVAAPPTDRPDLPPRDLDVPLIEEATPPQAPVGQVRVRQPRPTEMAGRPRPPVTAPRKFPASHSPSATALTPAENADSIQNLRGAILDQRRLDPGSNGQPERLEQPPVGTPITDMSAASTSRSMAESTLPANEYILLDELIAHIVKRSRNLMEMIDRDEKPPIDLILQHGRETTEHLIDLFSRNVSQPLRRINGDLGEILDLIMLMQLEKGHAPADDTVTLLLQIRRDLETLRAA